MPSQDKPNVNTVWASEGEANPVPATKQAQGYVDEIPYFDDFNGHMKLISEFLKHVNQEGVARWDSDTAYFTSAWVKAPDGRVFKALRDNKGKSPATNPLDWLLMSFERPSGLARFTTSGSFTVPAGVTSLQVSGCAGGGGGGGGAGSSSPFAGGGGGGGGAGESVIKEVVTVTPGQVIEVVIGNGGNRGLGNVSSAGTGTAGGTTRFGDFITLAGGRAGVGGRGDSGSGGAGGAPGGQWGGDAQESGKGGNGGSGASGPFGTGGGGGRAGTGTGTVVAGTEGSGYGTGGAGGGANYYPSSGRAGAPGTVGMPGLLIIEWR